MQIVYEIKTSPSRPIIMTLKYEDNLNLTGTINIPKLFLK